MFCDTHKELPETYEYLLKIEAYLGKPIVRLCDDRGFDHWSRYSKLPPFLADALVYEALEDQAL